MHLTFPMSGQILFDMLIMNKSMFIIGLSEGSSKALHACIECLQLQTSASGDRGNTGGNSIAAIGGAVGGACCLMVVLIAVIVIIKCYSCYWNNGSGKLSHIKQIS